MRRESKMDVAMLHKNINKSEKNWRHSSHLHFRFHRDFAASFGWIGVGARVNAVTEGHDRANCRGLCRREACVSEMAVAKKKTNIRWVKDNENVDLEQLKNYLSPVKHWKCFQYDVRGARKRRLREAKSFVSHWSFLLALKTAKITVCKIVLKLLWMKTLDPYNFDPFVAIVQLVAWYASTAYTFWHWKPTG